MGGGRMGTDSLYTPAISLLTGVDRSTVKETRVVIRVNYSS